MNLRVESEIIKMSQLVTMTIRNSSMDYNVKLDLVKDFLNTFSTESFLNFLFDNSDNPVKMIAEQDGDSMRFPVNRKLTDTDVDYYDQMAIVYDFKKRWSQYINFNDKVDFRLSPETEAGIYNMILQQNNKPF